MRILAQFDLFARYQCPAAQYIVLFQYRLRNSLLRAFLEYTAFVHHVAWGVLDHNGGALCIRIEQGRGSVYYIGLCG